jgi:hypothetical protein
MPGKNPTLTVVAGREGPIEGPYSNAARIAMSKPSANRRKRRRYIGVRASAMDPT